MNQSVTNVCFYIPIQGEKGMKGEKGSDGPKGDKGDRGPNVCSHH